MSHNPAIENMRTDRALLESEIAATGSAIRGDACTCPHPDHEDRHPSASIHAGTDGVVRVTCHSRGCFGKGADLFDLRAALTGRPVAELLREARGDTTPRPRSATKPPASAPDMLATAKGCTAALTAAQRDDLADQLGLSPDSLDRLRLGWITASELKSLNTKCSAEGCYTFPMRDESGRVAGVRLRTPGGFKYAVNGGHNALFIPANLNAGGTLYVVEGPTDCAAMLDCGLNAIGRPSNTAGEDLIVGYVREHKPAAVVIVIDSDPDGSTAKATIDAANKLAARLVPLVGDVRTIQPPAPFKDVRAWCQAGATTDDIEAAADAAESQGASAELLAMFEAEARGERQAIAWPWRLVTRGTQALIPGTITLIVGDPGSGKSLFVTEAMAHWHDNGLPVAGYMLERNRAEHLRRALAQRVGVSWITDIEGTAGRADEAIAMQREHAGWLDRFGRTIHTPGDASVTLGSLLGWVKDRAQDGARIIAIDPITVADTSARPWDDARQFMREAGRIVEASGASLVLVTHPAKTKGRASGGMRTLDDLAGGSAWSRFSDTVLWLERHDVPRTVTVRDTAFPIPQSATIERTLRVMKARHGRGAGWQLAITMDPESLRFTEQGAVVARETSEANR